LVLLESDGGLLVLIESGGLVFLAAESDGGLLVLIESGGLVLLATGIVQAQLVVEVVRFEVAQRLEANAKLQRQRHSGRSMRIRQGGLPPPGMEVP
jgi:hypothetical protein